jgi:hydroxysqualene synthase
LEGARVCARGRGIMTTGPVWDPGEKTHRDENFPVASGLVSKKHRAIILAFYNFARAGDDIADDPDLGEREKIEQLDVLEATLLGQDDNAAVAIPLRKALAERGLSPRHGQDLLVAFRMDARKNRYKDWNDLLGYCQYSANPVGRFVLDVHGESRDSWAANDALCSALQINNHLQDCGADYRRLNRVYVPADALAAHGATVEELGAAKSSPALLACIHELAGKTSDLLGQADLSRRIADLRLSLEVGAIERMARKIVRLLMTRDPLSQRVHLSKPAFAMILMSAVAVGLSQRLFLPRASQTTVLQGSDDRSTR